jgi:hypothetical protein
LILAPTTILNFPTIKRFNYNYNSSKVAGGKPRPAKIMRVRAHSQIEASMESAVYQVDVFWHENATIWVATSQDVPGLATEATTIEFLRQKLLRNMIPNLLLSNHVISSRHTANVVLKYAGLPKAL